MPVGPDQLLDRLLALLVLVRAGRGRHVERLVDVDLELLERQRPVVQGGREPEAEVDQDLLAGAVVLVHADHLRDRHVRLVHDEQPVRREVVQQRPGPAARLALREVSAVVLDAGAVAQLPQHLEVEGGPLAQACRLERPALGLHLADPQLHLGLDVGDGLAELVLGRHEVRGGEDVELLALRQELAGERIQLRDPLHLVPEELDADDDLGAGRADLQGVAADPEPGARQGGVIALVLEVHEVAQHGVPPVLAADLEPQDRGAVVHRGAQAVDARHRRHDDHVPPLEQGVGRRVAEPVDLLVPAAVLLDVGVRPGQVRLRLVVVEVADEVLDGVVREELPELAVELGGQRLVVGKDQRGLVVPDDGLGHREGLA